MRHRRAPSFKFRMRRSISLCQSVRAPRFGASTRTSPRSDRSPSSFGTARSTRTVETTKIPWPTGSRGRSSSIAVRRRSMEPWCWNTFLLGLSNSERSPRAVPRRGRVRSFSVSLRILLSTSISGPLPCSRARFVDDLTGRPIESVRIELLTSKGRSFYGSAGILSTDERGEFRRGGVLGGIRGDESIRRPSGLCGRTSVHRRNEDR
jgi:hypothetical protein